MGNVAHTTAHAVHEVGYLWLIALFPFVGAAINGIIGKKLQDAAGKRANHTIAIAAMLASFAVAVLGFVKLLGLPAGERALVTDLFPMVQVGEFEFHFSFYMDQLSGLMTLIITGIGTLIHVYSTGYMHSEPAYWRFFCYLNLFVFSMLLLVLGDSFLLMFFGWEGVGLCSYLLIGFWYKDFDKATAGMKAFVVNRVGDFAFITGLFLLFWGVSDVVKTNSYLNADENYDARRQHLYAAVARLDPAADPEERVAEAARLAPVVAGYQKQLDQYHLELDAWTEGGELGPAPAAPAAPDEDVIEMRLGGTVVFRELAQQLAYYDPVENTHPIRDDLTDKKILGIPVLFLVCVFFFIGACGKSAQIPLYVWLPDAMAGPTPVSALIHAATMVTAGVYMIARLNFLFFLSPGAMSIVAFVGACTALFAATMALFQYDIKKVLAYSTVSQLGFMFIGVGVGAWWVGVFHLLTHACFKACLFLGSGSVIHGMHFLEHHGHDDHGDGHDDHHHEPKKYTHDELRTAPNPHDPQDMRNMGGLATVMPQTRLTYLIACISIAGFPIAAGFYSKDEILWKAMSNGATLIPGWLIWALGFVAAGCTAFYMFRSYYMTFHRRPPTPDIQKHCHESPASMTVVLWILAILAVVTAFLGLPHALGFHPAIEGWLEPVMSGGEWRAASGFFASHALEWALIAASIGIATGGWLLARYWYFDESKTLARQEALKARYAGAHRLLYNKYWVDEIYQATFVRGFDALSRALAWFDARIVDWVVNATGQLGLAAAWLGGFIDRLFVDGAVNGVAKGIMAIGREGRKLQTGKINNYAWAIAAGVLVLVIIGRLAL